MTAYKASQAAVEEAAAQAAIDAAIDRISQAAEQRQLDEFLFAEEVVPSWSAGRKSHKGKYAKAPRGCPVKHRPHWKCAEHKGDKAKYAKALQGNPDFARLTARQQDLLLLRLCSFRFPGPGRGALGLNHGVKFCRYSSQLPTQLPHSHYWLLCRSRLQLGAEAVVLQGADLADLPACRPGGPFNDREVQDLAGNAFHVWQFVAWFFASFEAIQF